MRRGARFAVRARFVEGDSVSSVAAVMIGFSFGFIVAEVAYRYFNVDLRSFL